MLHAMLWNEIHALQSVPPPSQLELLLRLCSNKEHARRRTETKRTKCRRLPSVSAASGVARETIQILATRVCPTRRTCEHCERAGTSVPSE